MIALLAGLAFQTTPAIVVVPVPDAKHVTVQALVKIPKLNDAEQLCLRAAWDTILEGSLAYSKPTLKSYMQQTGKPVVARVLGDHLFVRVTFPPDQLRTAVTMMLSVLREPALRRESLEKVLLDLQEPKTDAWSAALDPERWREAKPTEAEILSTFRRVVRPENVTLAFGGAVDSAAVSQMSVFSAWKPAAERGFVRSWAATRSYALKSPDRVGIVELFGPEFGPADPGRWTHLLAAAGLGMGRGSALFRLAREELGWSYRQEGFLQPTSVGLRVRLLLAHTATGELHEKIDPLRDGLAKLVEAWNQADRQRAAAALKLYFEDGVGPSPIRLLPEGAPLASLEERTHLAAWWQMKFGEEFQPSRIVEGIEKVTLDDWKSAAKAIVEQSSARLLVANP